MKRFFAMILAVAMVFSFAACGTQHIGSYDSDRDDGNSNNKTDSLSDSSENVGFEETVVIDNEICKVTITDIKPHEVNYYGTAYYAITTLLTNKKDTALTFDILQSYVNGVYCPYDGINIWSVEKGKTEEVDIIIWHSDLEKLSRFGVSEFTDFEMKMNVSDEYFHVYPMGEEKAYYYTRNNAEDITVTDFDQATIKVMSFEENDEYYIMNLYLLSKNPYWLRFNLFCNIDGVYPENTTEWIIYPEKSNFATVKWQKSELNQKGISSVDEIEIDFIIEDTSERYANDTIIINP